MNSCLQVGKLVDRKDSPVGAGNDSKVNDFLIRVSESILGRHDILLLGLRGQAKSRIIRLLPQLLDEYIPVVAGSELNDDPRKPMSKFARELYNEYGDEMPIAWRHRSERYAEKWQLQIPPSLT